MHAPLNKSYQVEWRGLTALAPLADDIRALAGRAVESNVFYEPAFMLAAEPVFGADAGAMLVRSAAGRLAGLFPARVGRPQGGLSSMLIGWTHPFAPLGVPLVDREDAEGVIAAWLGHLAQNAERPALLLLPHLPDQGAFATALDAVLAQNRQASATFDPHERALVDPGTDRAGYIERAVSAGRRKELRRQRRRLEDLAPVSFVQASSPDDVGAALKDFLVLEASGWKGAAGTAIVNDPAVKAFVENAVVGLAADGHARVDRMLLDGRAIATTVTLQSGNTAWCWKIAYSEGVARFSPGVQLICELTERLMIEPGVAQVDSCAAADHPMIDHIWHERLALSDRLISLRRSAMPFALACRMERLRRGAIATAKQLRTRLRGR
jgi:CelD/BcsL family acetyltransferase involved in cellulose biosynthesis